MSQSEDPNDIYLNLPNEVDKIIAIVKRLREPGGCPWDQKQTHQSLLKYLDEESQEVKQEIENKRYGDTLKEELGDLLLQVFLHARLAEEQGEFNFNDVVEFLRNKLVTRHPHVFGDNPRELTDEELDKQWNEIKKGEREARKKVKS